MSWTSSDRLRCDYSFGDNSFLDSQGFTPFGFIDDEGMRVVRQIYSGYGEDPQQHEIEAHGNEYLTSNFPRLSYIVSTSATGSTPDYPEGDISGSSSWSDALVLIAAVLAVVAVVKCASGGTRDTEVARAKRSQGTQDFDYDDENEGAGLLGGGGDSEAPNWDPDYRSGSERKVVLARPKDAAAGVM